MTREIIRSTVKHSAENDLYIKPKKLIRRELRNTENFTTNLEHSDVCNCYEGQCMKLEKTLSKFTKIF